MPYTFTSTYLPENKSLIEQFLKKIFEPFFSKSIKVSYFLTAQNLTVPNFFCLTRTDGYRWILGDWSIPLKRLTECIFYQFWKQNIHQSRVMRWQSYINQSSAVADANWWITKTSQDKMKRSTIGKPTRGGGRWLLCCNKDYHRHQFIDNVN